ncbi:MAG: T9SS type A sorting domain-containing protein [Bacteroidota bacterium]
MKKLIPLLLLLLCLSISGYTQRNGGLDDEYEPLEPEPSPSLPTLIVTTENDVDDYSEGDNDGLRSLREAVRLVSHGDHHITFASGILNVHLEAIGGPLNIAGECFIDGGSGVTVTAKGSNIISLSNAAEFEAYNIHFASWVTQTSAIVVPAIYSDPPSIDVTQCYFNEISSGIGIGGHTASLIIQDCNFVKSSIWLTAHVPNTSEQAYAISNFGVGTPEVYPENGDAIDIMYIDNSDFGGDWFSGINIRNSNIITISNSRFYDLGHHTPMSYIGFLNCNNVTINGDIFLQNNNSNMIHSINSNIIVKNCTAGLRSGSTAGTYVVDPVYGFLKFENNNSSNRSLTFENNIIFTQQWVLVDDGKLGTTAVIKNNQINYYLADGMTAPLLNNTNQAYFRFGIPTAINSGVTQTMTSSVSVINNTMHIHYAYKIGDAGSGEGNDEVSGLAFYNVLNVTIEENKVADFNTSGANGAYANIIRVYSNPARTETCTLSIKKNRLESYFYAGIKLEGKFASSSGIFENNIKSRGYYGPNLLSMGGADWNSGAGILISNSTGTITVTAPFVSGTGGTRTSAFTQATLGGSSTPENKYPLVLVKGSLCNVILNEVPLYNTLADGVNDPSWAVLLLDDNATAKPRPEVLSMETVGTNEEISVQAVTGTGAAATRVDCYATDKINLSKRWLTSVSTNTDGVFFFNLAHSLLSAGEFFIFTATYTNAGTSMLSLPKLFNANPLTVNNCTDWDVTIGNNAAHYFMGSTVYTPLVTNSGILKTTAGATVTPLSPGVWNVGPGTYLLACTSSFSCNALNHIYEPTHSLYASLTMPYSNPMVSLSDPEGLSFNNAPAFSLPVVKAFNICPGSGAVLSILTSPGLSLGFQWQSAVIGGSFSNITLPNSSISGGVTSSTLTLVNMPVSPSVTRYRCVITNAVCTAFSINSGEFTITVKPLPTFELSASCLTISLNPSPATGTVVTWYKVGSPDVSVSTGVNDFAYTPTDCGDYYATCTTECAVVTSGSYEFSTSLTPSGSRKVAPALEMQNTTIHGPDQSVVYPNPTTGPISLKLTGEMRVSDMQGRTVYNEPVTDISNLPSPDLGNQPAGTYILSVHMGGSPVLRQTVVKK